MDAPNPPDKLDVSSYDASWEKWRTEQVKTITHILSTVFKVEDEARQIQAPSRLLRKSSIASSEAEEEIRKKLNQIREQISEYEQMLKLGLKRIENALEEIEPAKPQASLPPETSAKPSLFKKFIHKLQALRS